MYVFIILDILQFKRLIGCFKSHLVSKFAFIWKTVILWNISISNNFFFLVYISNILIIVYIITYLKDLLSLTFNEGHFLVFFACWFGWFAYSTWPKIL